jgi:hypothetical protein
MRLLLPYQRRRLVLLVSAHAFSVKPHNVLLAVKARGVVERVKGLLLSSSLLKVHHLKIDLVFE